MAVEEVRQMQRKRAGCSRENRNMLQQRMKGLALGGAALFLAGIASGQAKAAVADSRLMEAVDRGDRQVVQSLISAHVDVNTTAFNGATPLASAVHRDD